MTAILPLVFYAALTRLIWIKDRKSLGYACLLAAVLMGAGTFAATEVLSFFKLLNFSVLVALWSSAVLAAGLANSPLKFKGPRAGQMKAVEKSWILIGCLLALLVLLPVALTALKAAPGTWDSMTYHLSRVEHWAQDASLRFYPTNCDRQLWKDYGNEIFVLHLRILSGGDRLCNLVQLLSWFGCMLAAWTTLDFLGRPRWEKLFAVVFIATIPMSILQATSTQGDLVGGFWMMVLVYFILQELAGEPGFALVWAGLALGNALLTRETNYLYAWPFLVWLGWGKLKAKGWLQALRAIGIVAALAVMINGPHYARNYVLYHKLLSPGNEGLVNQHWTATTLLVNAARNTLMHMTTPFLGINDQILRWEDQFFRHCGINLQDPSSMITDQFSLTALSLDEDYAQNPLHMIFLLAVLVYAAWRSLIAAFRRNQIPPEGAYVLCLAAAMATFALVLKWQPFHTRLHLIIFVLAAVPIAVMTGRLRKRWAMSIIMKLLIIASLFCVFMNDDRPWVGPSSIWHTQRYQQYYKKRPVVAVHDRVAFEIFNKTGCDQVGLLFRGEAWEYPFWVMMREKWGKSLRMEQVEPGNETERLAYPLGDFDPCGIYMVPSDGSRMVVLQGRLYGRIWENTFIDGSRTAVFLPVR